MVPFAKINSLMAGHNDLSIHQWIDKLQANGAYSFSKAALQQELTSFSDIAVKRALNRLSAKGKIVSFSKGYYLILPPQYTSKGILPPMLFLDAFMKHLNRPYYLAMLNAAALHGAAHQQPQAYFVMTNFPVLRPTEIKGLTIHYISINKIPESLIEKRKTEAGYVNISNAALTACDLVQFEKRIGGINRVATILNELSEVLKTGDFSTALLQQVNVTALQRLGYLMEMACFNKELADALYQAMEKEKLPLYRIPLKTIKETKGYSSDNRWKVIVNTEIEIEE